MKKEEKDGNPVLYLFKKMWQCAEGSRTYIILYVCCFIIAGMIDSLVEPYIWSRVMNQIQKEGLSRENVFSLIGSLGIILAAILVFWSIHGPARVLERYIAFKIKINYRDILTKGLLGLPLSWHKAHHSGITVDQMSKGTQALFSFSETTFEIIYSCLELVIGCTMLAWYFPSSLVLTIGMLIVSVWTISRFDKVLNMNNKKLARSENAISQIVVDVIGNMTTVIALRIGKRVYGSIMDKTREPLDLFNKNNKVNEVKWFLTGLLCNVMIVVVLGLYLYTHIGLGVKFGDIFLLQSYLRNTSKLFSRFASLYNRAMIQHINVMNAEELSVQFIEESLVPHVLPLKWKRIRIKNLTFSYGGNSTRQLRDISLKIQRGQHVAFVGKTGSGKSTMLGVIRDLQQPESLRLSVDGEVIQDGFAGIAEAIALIPQEPEIFASTVLENITLGVTYPDELIQEALCLSQFDEVVRTKLPQGLDTRLGEDGMTLSGGQKQRLALARGLLACMDKDIILADEPTSSLDKSTARKVFSDTLCKFEDKTVICVVHDLEMLSFFDTICVFDEGRLVGVGSYDQLLKTCRSFQNLCKVEVV